MSWLTLLSPAAASSGVNRASNASMSHVAGVSPVNCMVLRRSDHGPSAKFDSMPPRSSPPSRANEKPRTPRAVPSSAYAWLMKLSGATCGSDVSDPPQVVQ